MQVNFDNLRKKMATSYNGLVGKLNSSVKDESWDPHIIISAEEIREELELLRISIGTLLSLESEGNFESVDDVDLEIFNDKDQN